jgi:molybdenum cofactor synthesis domain-containing protein
MRDPLSAWIIAIGSELLTPSRIDTNSLAITERLNTIGVDVRRKVIVGDDVEELSGALRQGLSAADVLVCTGGLGPTEDDVTRDAIARVLATPLDLHEPTMNAIRARFAMRGLTMPDINRRQAMVPRGAMVLENRH